jgi:hypothetical protein
MVKVFRLTQKKIKIKGSLHHRQKITKMASSGYMGSSSKIWSSGFRLINGFLNRKIKLSVKNPNAEEKAVLPMYILPQPFTVPHWFY